MKIPSPAGIKKNTRSLQKSTNGNAREVRAAVFKLSNCADPQIKVPRT